MLSKRLFLRIVGMVKARPIHGPKCFLALVALAAFPSLAWAGFAEEALPILSGHCFQCHGPDAKERKAGLRLDSFAGATADLGGYAAIVPGDVEKSVMLERIGSGSPDQVMPPPETKLALTDREKEVLRRWIASGAEYEEHWAFVPPVRPELPGGNAHPIDAFIGERLRREGLSFSPEASAERLIRRVTQDLTGLPPSIEEIESFTAVYARKADAAYEALVDRLLASPRYGETMALPWLDAARFADTDGYQYDGPRFMWRWRDWVIDAYNTKMPFDQFTIEQLAGDLLPDPTLEQRIATGFNRNHRYNSEAGIVVEEFLLENAVDRVDTTATLWMGLTMGCARCHDHKFDPFSQKEYYQLIAFFNSVPEAGRAIKSGNSEPVMTAPTRAQQIELDRREKALKEAMRALVPGDRKSEGDLLIDRHLLHRFFEETAHFDGRSTVELDGIDKKLRFRANQTFGISLWFRAGTAENGVILSRQNAGSTRPGIEIALVDGGRIQFDLITRWLAGVGRATTKKPLPVGEWVHLTVTNDASQSANGQHIYVNGRRVETVVTHNTNSNTGGVGENRPLVVGGGLRPASRPFVGAVRDFRLYDIDLWPEEVAVLGSPEDASARDDFARIKPAAAYAHYVKLREDLDRYRKSLPSVMVMEETSRPKPTYVRNRGVYHDHGDRVQRDVPAKLPPLREEWPRNRLGLAKWLVSPEHPLTARVAVNRYWQKYFGTGLVKTAEDFGVQGEKPSHPGLLDWLATEFVGNGWDVARMQKLIVTSRTYRQQSRVTRTLLERDPDNRLLSRGRRLRLSGHAIRDQALFVSGLLQERIGGPSVSPYQPANLWAEMSMGIKYRQGRGEDLYRRSLYTVWKRTVAPPVLSVFDAAGRETCWVTRKETNTPLQALTLLNETGFVESARHLAVRMLEEGAGDPIAFGFRAVTARTPLERERAVLERALAEYRDLITKDAAAEFIRIGESSASRDHPPRKLAAYMALANVLLNLDEVITHE